MNILSGVNSSILLDVGGSYIKSAVIRAHSSKIENVLRFQTPAFIDQNSLLKVIPTDTFLDIIEKAISAQKAFSIDANRIFTSGQMGGFVKQHNDSFELISWQDKRSCSPENRFKLPNLKTYLGASNSFKETGSELREGLPLVAMALEENALIRNENSMPFRSIISFVTSYLTGFKSTEMHVTDAASSGFFNLRYQKWDTELCALVNSSVRFPVVSSEIRRIGYSAKFELEVYSGVGDQQASLLGAGLSDQNIVVNIGTGGQVAGLITELEFSNSFQVRPYFHGKRVRTITHLPSGRALTAFARYCLDKDILNDSDYLEFEKLAGRSISDYQLNLEDFEIALRNVRESEFRIDYEVVAYSFFSALVDTYANALTKIHLPGQLLFAGGVGQRVKLISELLAKKIRRPYSISSSEETTLEGLSVIAKWF